MNKLIAPFAFLCDNTCMKNTQKGFIVPIIIIIVAVLAIGGGTYVYTKNNQNTETNTSANATSTPSIQGTYEKQSASITITQLSGSKIKVEGNAVNSQANSSILDGEATLVGNKAIYSKDGCEVELVFKDNTLTAKDNNQCGGLNVTFTGDYIKDTNPSSTTSVKSTSNANTSISKNIVGSWLFETSSGSNNSEIPLDSGLIFEADGTFMTAINRGPGDSVAGYDGTWTLKNGGLSLTFKQLQKEWFFEKVEATNSSLTLSYKGNTKIVYKKAN